MANNRQNQLNQQNNCEEVEKVGFFEEKPGVLSSGRLIKFVSLLMGFFISILACVGWFMGKDPTPILGFATLAFTLSGATQISQNVTGH